jgi:ATP-dependent Lon protease
MAPFKTSSKNDLKNRLRNNKNNKLKKNKPDSDSDSDKEVDEEESEYETVEESSDSSYKPPKSNKKKVSRRRIVTSEDEEEEENDEESIGSEDSEDEEDEDEYDSDDSFIEDDEPEVKLSAADIQKAIAKIFPSRYMNEKVKKTKESEKKSSKKADKKSKKSNKKRRQESESDEEEEDEEESSYVSEDDEEEEYDSEDAEEENDKVFILSIGGGEDEEDDEEIYNDEDDRGECDSDDEKTFMKENYETVELPSEHKKKADKKSKKEKAKKEKANKKSDEETSENNVESEYVDLLETKKQLTNQLHKKPKSKILLNAIEDCNKSIKKLVKKARIKNAKAYHKLIHEDKKNTNEVDYFKKNLSNKEQLKVMKDLKEINRHMNIDKPYRLALLESKIPAKLKAVALQKLNVLKYMDPGDNEYYKIKNWVDTFMRIPFGVYKEVSVKMDDGIETCHSFMQKSKDILDECVYGLNDAKLQILQMVGQWISNPSALGTAIAIKGPMGTGKTSLIKDGISKILGREFAFIALGGAGDSSFLDGHSYTYEGSTWGKIVQILIDCKCMNPVIYFDELDKVSDTPRGEEIIGILTHLTDTSQNSQFHDKYFADVDFDLSKCLFIFSYNDEYKVNPILRDRMYRIQTKGYETKEKQIIARDYLLPKIREQVNFKNEDVIIPDDTIQYIASSTTLTSGESGVRNMKRCLEIIYTKLNLFRLVKPESNIFNKEIDMKVSFPFTVTRKEVDKLIKVEDDPISKTMLAMYC